MLKRSIFSLEWCGKHVSTLSNKKSGGHLGSWEGDKNRTEKLEVSHDTHTKHPRMFNKHILTSWVLTEFRNRTHVALFLVSTHPISYLTQRDVKMGHRQTNLRAKKSEKDPKDPKSLNDNITRGITLLIYVGLLLSSGRYLLNSRWMHMPHFTTLSPLFWVDMELSMSHDDAFSAVILILYT